MFRLIIMMVALAISFLAGFGTAVRHRVPLRVESRPSPQNKARQAYDRALRAEAADQIIAQRARIGVLKESIREAEDALGKAEVQLEQSRELAYRLQAAEAAAEILSRQLKKSKQTERAAHARVERLEKRIEEMRSEETRVTKAPARAPDRPTPGTMPKSPPRRMPVMVSPTPKPVSVFLTEDSGAVRLQDGSYLSLIDDSKDGGALVYIVGQGPRWVGYGRPVRTAAGGVVSLIAHDLQDDGASFSVAVQ